VGRLLPHPGQPAVHEFAALLVKGAPRPWVRLLHPTLHPPGTPLIRTLEGHPTNVNGVALSPNRRCAVSASGDKTLKVWDLETGRELRTLQGHSGRVIGVAVSPDGRWAVSAGDVTLKVWHLETGEAVATFTCDASALCCAFAGVRSIVTGDSAGRVHFLELMEKS
jgi:WD40 repeat protein